MKKGVLIAVFFSSIILALSFAPVSEAEHICKDTKGKNIGLVTPRERVSSIYAILSKLAEILKKSGVNSKSYKEITTKIQELKKSLEEVLCIRKICRDLQDLIVGLAFLGIVAYGEGLICLSYILFFAASLLTIVYLLLLCPLFNRGSSTNTIST